jgi:hypothetical protein
MIVNKKKQIVDKSVGGISDLAAFARQYILIWVSQQSVLMIKCVNDSKFNSMNVKNEDK